VICSHCRAESPAGARFCANCGAALEPRSCPVCGVTLTPQARFCPGCGRVIGSPGAPTRFGSPATYTPRRLAERILNERRALEGERKEVTVLFADLRGSMELIADRDPEQAREVLDQVLQLMMEAVHRYEGTVNQIMGDGIMAIFGAPLAHEDHAVRACYAALRMQESLKGWGEEARRELGIAVAIRVGLNSGDVIVRAIGNDLHMDYTAVGRPTHLAARIEQMATPGSVLLSGETAARATGFIETRALGPLMVRGLKEPVDLHELLAATAVRTRLQRAAALGFTRFVGRDHELGALLRAADEARRGHGRGVVIVGEAGVGKSRLVWELSRTLTAEHWLVLEGHCLSYDRSSAYAPIIEIMRTYFDVQPSDDAVAVSDRIASGLVALDPSLVVYRSAFQQLLDVPVSDERWRRLDPLERRRDTMRAVQHVLVRESQVRPVLVAVDDLHWVDVDSEALLQTIVDAVPMASMLVLVGHRPEYDAPWSGRAHCEKLRLEALSAESASLLLDALLGEQQELTPLRRLLMARTEGNPFFLEESVAMLATEGVLTGERGRYALASTPAAINIPTTVRAVVAWRIDQLSSDDKRLLEAAAVVGKDVPLSVLSAIADVADEELHASLARLRSAEFLYEARLFPEIEYAFKHPVTHEVAYEELAHDRRRAMHARVFSALRQQLDSTRIEEHLGALASHAFRGGLWEEAVTWLRGAGAKAAVRSASAEAVTRFEQALQALAHLPVTQATLDLAMDIRFELRNPLFLLADFPRALAVLEDVSTIAESIDDEERLGRASAFMANAHFMLGNVDRGIALAERARLIGEKHGDAALLAFAWCHLGQLRYVSGDHAAAVSAMASCIECLRGDAVQRRRGIVQLYGVVAHCFVALAEAARGRMSEAIAAAERCATAADQSAAPFYRALAHWALGVAHVARGTIDVGLAALRQAQTECGGADIRSIRPWIAGDLGLALLLSGHGVEAVAVLDAAVGEAASLQLFAAQSSRLERLAQALLAAGKPVEARDAALHAVQKATTHGEHGFRGSSLRSLGATELELNELTSARMHLDEALALAERCEMLPLAARCHVDLAALHARADDQVSARRAVATGVEILRGLGLEMPPWMAAQVSALRLRPDVEA
jgi:class 3 adenylate cyclase/tetratricopeptide (TPR) repeat protein